MIVIDTGEQQQNQPYQQQEVPKQQLPTHYQLPIMTKMIPQLNSQAKISLDNLKKLISEIIEKMKSSIMNGETTHTNNPDLAIFLQQTSEYTDLIQSQGEQYIVHDKN
tara:strand:+ start:444 stop:767 length:324 start_codon:yes stop_codon:yes gene_type:complete